MTQKQTISIHTIEDPTSFTGRWKLYFKERFPVFKFAPLLLAFSFCALCVSSLIRNVIAWPELQAVLTAFTVVFLFFLQLRILDEFKDYETDCKFRPERAIPRGLVTLKNLAVLGIISAGVQATLSFMLHPALLIFLAAVWAYMFLMTVEFFVAEWIKPKLFIYMWTHMLIMPFIDLFASSTDWIFTNWYPPAGLALFLGVSFFNGILVELGRKTWAPEQERPGVDSYSSYWGLKKALMVFYITLLLSFIGALGVSVQMNFMLPAICVLSVPAAYGLKLSMTFLKNPTPEFAKKLENFSGIWVIASYLVMGIIPMGYRLWIL